MKEEEYPEVKQEDFYDKEYQPWTLTSADAAIASSISVISGTVISNWNDYGITTKPDMDNIINSLDVLDTDYDDVIPNLQVESLEVQKDVTLTGKVTPIDIPNTKIQTYPPDELYNTKRLKQDIKTSLLQNNKEDIRVNTVLDDIKRIQQKEANRMDTAVNEGISEYREIQRSDDYSVIEKTLASDAYYYLSLSTLDSRTTEICRELDGMKYNVKYELIPNKPKRHFGCRSLIVLMLEEYDLTEAQRAQGLPKTDITYMTYKEWST